MKSAPSLTAYMPAGMPLLNVLEMRTRAALPPMLVSTISRMAWLLNPPPHP
jgi:hypothetical protein